MYICNNVLVCEPYVYNVNVVGECFSLLFSFYYLLLAAVALFSFFFQFQFAQPIGNRSLFLLNFRFKKCFSFFHLHMYVLYI